MDAQAKFCKVQLLPLFCSNLGQIMQLSQFGLSLEDLQINGIQHFLTCSFGVSVLKMKPTPELEGNSVVFVVSLAAIGQKAACLVPLSLANAAEAVIYIRIRSGFFFSKTFSKLHSPF